MEFGQSMPFTTRSFLESLITNIVLDLVTKLLYIFILTSLLDLLSKHEYFHIHMDFVILYGSTE